MVEVKGMTGGRDDLHVDPSRCLRMRYSESTCSRCNAICPHGAVTIDGVLALNPALCHGCLLCTTVCPVGALEPGADFVAGVAQLSRVAEPVLGCIRTKEHSHAHLACLGGLSPEHLLLLFHTLTGSLTLNLSLCGDCPNGASISELQRRLTVISSAGLAGGTCRMVLAESGQDIHFRHESVDRRNFFKTIGQAIFKKTEVILANAAVPPTPRTAYAEKRVPVRRVLLNITVARLSAELAGTLRAQFTWAVTFTASCTRCQGCVAICPTGALSTQSAGAPPTFTSLGCTGCGLCVEFCFDRAVRLSALTPHETDGSPAADQQSASAVCP